MTRMKDSGIEWIGEVPEEWGITKIKFITQLNGRIGWQGLTSAEYKEEGPYLITGTDFLDGKINFETAVHIDEKRWFEAKQIQVENGELLITKDGTVGKVAIIEGLNEKASLNSGVLRIQTTKNISRRFLFYVLKSDVFWLWFNYTNSGASTILHLYQNVFDEFSFTFPNISEQTQIADFLDKKVAQLDKVKSLLEEQIKTLEDYRQSLIYETVTKGLDKTVPLKDSGVDWIGQMPEGWGRKRLKYLVNISTGTSNTQDKALDEEGYPFFVRSQTVEKLPTYTHDEEVILTAGDGVGVGKVFHYYKGKFTAHQRVYLLTRFEQIDAKYLFYYFSSNLKNEVLLGGAKSTVDSIRLPMLTNFVVTLPSTDEQTRIADFLDKKTEQINQMIAIKKEQIKNINKQRQTLIYDYVTGKRRV
ncbi:restriction endonuclease subunit S [Streptococcus suis]|uniref:Type I restriction modification DNA specificity protein n=1 Tax=Streptococcus suis TaxID=1307 RepID=A0AB33UDD9_STRSU|nr:restriction endonuclease subunit S [Streptococcus suis]CYX79068.1 type I restriction modification DNA specificity protein [Streptococcus suis]